MNLFPSDDARLQELILHIALCCEDMDTFDTHMLNLILFQADFLHFRRHGFPITGQSYRRGIRTPFPRNLPRVFRSLIEVEAIESLESSLGDGLHIRKTLRALREPSLQIFDGREVGVVDMVIRAFREANVLEKTWPDPLHIPWESARYREEIPYSLALVAGRHSASAYRNPARRELAVQSVQQGWASPVC